MLCRHAANIRRPQLSFKDPVDNRSGTVFVPKLKTKPNATVPLKQSLAQAGADTVTHASPARKTPTNGGAAPEKSPMSQHMLKLGLAPPLCSELQYPHPYRPELEALEPSVRRFCSLCTPHPRRRRRSFVCFTL